MNKEIDKRTRKNKRLVAIVLIVFVVIASCGIEIHRTVNIWYSKQLVEAIETNNIPAIERIICDHPECINRFPGVFIPPVYWFFEDARHYPLTVAAEKGNIDIVRLLVEAGANVNCNDGDTPLSNAYYLKSDNWYQVTCYLIEKGANINYSRLFAYGTPPVLRDVIEFGKDDNIDEVNAAFNYAFEHCDHKRVNWPQVLLFAVSRHRLEITEKIISSGVCGVDAMDDNTTALMVATGKWNGRNLDPDLVQLLLDFGADPTIRDDNGYTAYDYAVMNDFTDAIELLSDNK